MSGSAPTVDLVAVERFLSERLAGVTDVEPLRKGEWSSAYGFRQGPRELVARFSAFHEDFEKDRIAYRYRTNELPIPRVVEIGEAFGGHYAVTERAHGEYLERLDAAALSRALPGLFAALDAMRTADLSATSGFGGWDAGGQAPHRTWRDALLEVGEDRPGGRVYGWRAALGRSPDAARAFEEGMGVFRRLAADCPNERHLVHGDLVYYNVLVSGARITAVFDWGSSIYGDFLHDIAWLTFWSPWYPNWKGIDLAGEARRHYASVGLDMPDFDERLRCYLLHIGLGGIAYAAWRGRWNEVDVRTAKVLALARGHE